MRSVHFLMAIAYDLFQMSKTKLKVAYWIKVDILKQYTKNFSYLSFGTVDVYWQHACHIKGFLMKISVCEYHYCLKDGKQSLLTHLTVNRKPQYPKTLPVTTCLTI